MMHSKKYSTMHLPDLHPARGLLHNRRCISLISILLEDRATMHLPDLHPARGPLHNASPWSPSCSRTAPQPSVPKVRIRPSQRTRFRSHTDTQPKPITEHNKHRPPSCSRWPSYLLTLLTLPYLPYFLLEMAISRYGPRDNSRDQLLMVGMMLMAGWWWGLGAGVRRAPVSWRWVV